MIKFWTKGCKQKHPVETENSLKRQSLSTVAICHPGDIRKYLKRFLVVTTGGRYWHQMGRDQACCQTSHIAQDSPPQQRMILPKLAIALRCWNFELDIWFETRKLRNNCFWSFQALHRLQVLFASLISMEQWEMMPSHAISHGIWNIRSPEFLLNLTHVPCHSLKQWFLMTFWSEDPFKLLRFFEGSKHLCLCGLYVLLFIELVIKTEKVLEYKYRLHQLSAWWLRYTPCHLGKILLYTPPRMKVKTYK